MDYAACGTVRAYVHQGLGGGGGFLCVVVLYRSLDLAYRLGGQVQDSLGPPVVHGWPLNHLDALVDEAQRVDHPGLRVLDLVQQVFYVEFGPEPLQLVLQI